jgi:hypothetical protein
MTCPPRSRPGGALIVAIVVLVLVECIVVAMVHAAMLERRAGGNVETALRLRLAAEAAANQAAARWSPAMDSLLLPGARLELQPEPVAGPHGVVTTARMERLFGGIFLVEAQAGIPQLPAARGSAALAVVAPLLATEADVATAALTAASATVTATGFIGMASSDPTSSHAASPCSTSGTVAIALSDLSGLDVSRAASIDGAVIEVDADAMVTRDMPRVRASALRAAYDSLLRFWPDRMRVVDGITGVVVAGRDLVVATGATFRGVAIVAGDLVVEEGGAIVGAAHVAGHAHVAGYIMLDPCAADSAAHAARLRHARPLYGRRSLPGF